jgi:hypothetical protein
VTEGLVFAELVLPGALAVLVYVVAVAALVAARRWSVGAPSPPRARLRVVPGGGARAARPAHAR